MIIKIIPEEGDHIKEEEHLNVKEFFLFGNKKDQDGALIDFHIWSGQYRYLTGSLHYFDDLLRQEQLSKKSNVELPPPSPTLPGPNVEAGDKKEGIIKKFPIDSPDLKIIQAENIAEEEMAVEEDDVDGVPSSPSAEDEPEGQEEVVVDADNIKGE